MFFTSSIVANSISYAKENGYDLLTKEEEFELISKAQNGDLAARDKMVLSNVRLVASIANQYNSLSMTMEDRFQEGMMGLYKAIDKFDISMGNRFSTYATWHIRQSILRSISNKDRVVRIPVYVVNNIIKVKKAICELDIDMYEIDDQAIRDISDFTGLDKTNVMRAIDNMDYPASLDAPYGTGEDSEDSDDATLLNTAVYHAGESSCTHERDIKDLEQSFLRSDLMEILDKVLCDREKIVITYKYGLVGVSDQGCSLADLSEKLSISSERVRQIEKHALEKLRRSGLIDELKDYIIVN